MSEENGEIPRLRCLWLALLDCLRSRDRHWSDRTGTTNSVDIGQLVQSEALTDSAIFEAFALALISGNTRWERIARIRGELAEPFLEFDPRRFAALPESDIETKSLAWFQQRKAGSANLRASLLRLKAAAATLSHGPSEGAARTYLGAALADGDGTPEALALALGASKTWKLPGFGIALAAEALRNLGIDLCKPDRHIQRAIGSWALVTFAHWRRRGAYTPPQPNAGELMATMLAVRSIAEANQTTVSYANSVIWYAGAVSGARLTNDEFSALSLGCS